MAVRDFGVLSISRMRDLTMAMTHSPASSLAIDLYQLTMAQAYHAAGMIDEAVFEFFIRKLPPCRNFLLTAGLEQAIDHLAGFRFTADDIDWLMRSRRFRPEFLDYLREVRFQGEVHAVAEGTVFFPDEPILRITAPLPIAQMVESRLINILHYQTLIASKAARIVLAGPEKTLIDFGFRRAHGAEAGLLAARASFIAGFAGTATVEAERAFGVPSFGTMAHSFVQAHRSEADAFRLFARTWPQDAVFLIDTYDTEEGARRVAALAPELARAGVRIKGVRLDSGNLVDLAFKVRKLLDAAGLTDVRIFASSSVDEYVIAEAQTADAPIDAYGIGTHLTTSSDAPYLDCAYKLQEYAGLPRRKRSTGKSTWPGRKQIYRRRDQRGAMIGDIVATEGERMPGEALVCPIVVGGERRAPCETLETIRRRAADNLTALPAALRGLRTSAPYPVEISRSLQRLAEEVDARVAAEAAERGGSSQRTSSS